MTAALDSWSPVKVTNVALRLQDVLHCIGPVVSFNEYWTQFHPGTAEDSARRSWELLKRTWRAVGLRFTLVRTQRQDQQQEGAWTAVMASAAHARAVVEHLIGPPLFKRTGRTDLKTIEDFFPGLAEAEVREFMDALGEDLAA